MKWNADPEIFRIGPIALRYYSLMFVIGFVTMDLYVKSLFRKHGKNPHLVSALTNYIVIGMIIGARLAHCFFYDPGYYFSHPLSILKVWEGGLASHGGYVGVMVAVFLFLKKYKELSFAWVMDLIVGPCLFLGFLIRIGNFFNSEIVGRPTDMPWGIIFEKVDYYPRHPAQLYESFGYLCIALFLNYLATKKFDKLPRGSVLAAAFIVSFTFRFFIEFFKDNQSTVSAGFPINMGQILSLVCVLAGFVMLKMSYHKSKRHSP